MRVALSVVTVILASSLLAGCNTVSEGQYHKAQTVLSTDAGAKRKFIKSCVVDQQKLALADRSASAAIMNVSISNYPQTFCRRMTNALTNGRITYSDYKGIMSGSGDISKFIYVMQGR